MQCHHVALPACVSCGHALMTLEFGRRLQQHSALSPAADRSSVGSQALALRGAAVTLTDCALMLPLLQRNVAANFAGGGARHGAPWQPRCSPARRQRLQGCANCAKSECAVTKDSDSTPEVQPRWCATSRVEQFKGRRQTARRGPRCTRTPGAPAWRARRWTRGAPPTTCSSAPTCATMRCPPAALRARAHVAPPVSGIFLHACVRSQCARPWAQDQFDALLGTVLECLAANPDMQARPCAVFHLTHMGLLPNTGADGRAHSKRFLASCAAARPLLRGCA